MNRNKLSLLSALAIIFVSWHVTEVNSANILGLFTSLSPSHVIVHMSLAKVLAEQGHNVTVVTTQVPKVKSDKINLIVIPPTEDQSQVMSKELSGMASKKKNFLTTITHFFGTLTKMIDLQVETMKDPRFIDLYENPGNKFDLVIVGYFMNSFQFGVAAKFQAPLIVSWSGSSMVWSDMLVGNPSGVSYVPDMNMAVKQGEKMDFWQRFQSLFSNLQYRLIKELLNIRVRNFYNTLFPNDGSFPSYSEMEKNVSLIFCNGHFSEGTIKPNVPAVVEIGGIQIKETPEPLPEDIAQFLDSANQTGAILFSLGSNLKGSSIKHESATYIYNVLSKLKQKVIWKWEDLKNTPGNSPNILYKKWMPQDDILAHRNLKLFITHAGKGGVAEAQYHGVPMVALPVFADQFGNAKKIVAYGYGQYLELLQITEETFETAVLEVLNNPQYKKNVESFSKLYRDRPLTARQNVAYWTDYVIRHHGAAHMKSPLMQMNFVEILNLDIYLLILVVVYLIYRIFKFIILFISGKIFKRSVKASKKMKKVKSH